MHETLSSSLSLREDVGVGVREGDTGSEVWLAADYHFPSTYSCKMPMSSMSSALALPAPGPGTVRLALIKVGIELYGLAYTKDVLFPVIRAADIYLRPPERVALSLQHVRAIKASAKSAHFPVLLQEALVYREHAHAQGLLTVYVRVPSGYAEVFCELLRAVGYWGQTSSLACCVGVSHATPDFGECGRELGTTARTERMGQAYSCVVTEFRDKHVKWKDVVAGEIKVEDWRNVVPGLRLVIYVWPMIAVQTGCGRLLHRQ